MNAAVNAFFLIFKLLSLYFFGCFTLLPVQAEKSRQLPPDSGGSPY